VAPPFRVAEFDIMNNGISQSGNLLDVGVELGIINKGGAFFRYEKEVIGQGREAAKMYLEESPKMAKQIEDKIWEQVKTGKLEAGKEIGEAKEE
jgi:recombination protein RecA